MGNLMKEIFMSLTVDRCLFVIPETKVILSTLPDGLRETISEKAIQSYSADSGDTRQKHPLLSSREDLCWIITVACRASNWMLLEPVRRDRPPHLIISKKKYLYFAHSVTS